MKCSARLMAIADFVVRGRPAADIGTDHCRLPVYLVKGGICPLLIASDKTSSSAAAAISMVTRLGLEDSILVRIGDGLSVLKPGEVATIILSGMGGQTIISILAAMPRVLEGGIRLVLQPQRDIPEVRAFLMESGWRIIDEKLVKEDGFYYQVIASEKGEMQLSEEELLFGPVLITNNSEMFKNYLSERLSYTNSLLARLDENSVQRFADLTSLCEIIEGILKRQR